MHTTNADRWVYCGVVIKPHGIRGELRVLPEAADEPFPSACRQVRLQKLATNTTATTNTSPVTMTVEQVRGPPGLWLMRLQEIQNRNDAELWRGFGVFVEAAMLPQVGPDGFYFYELPGAAVVDEDGQPLGEIAHVWNNGGQPLIELAVTAPQEPTQAPSPKPTQEPTRLLPLVTTTFVSFNRNLRLLTVRVPDGLWS